jgi:hypothetical protein
MPAESGHRSFANAGTSTPGRNRAPAHRGALIAVRVAVAEDEAGFERVVQRNARQLQRGGGDEQLVAGREGAAKSAVSAAPARHGTDVRRWNGRNERSALLRGVFVASCGGALDERNESARYGHVALKITLGLRAAAGTRRSQRSRRSEAVGPARLEPRRGAAKRWGAQAGRARWLGRFALAAHGVSIDALRAAADALDALGDRPDAAMERLGRLCAAHRVS